MLDVEAGQSKVTDCGLDGSYDTKGDNVTYTYVFDDFGRTVTVSCMDGDRNIINAAGGVYSEKRDTAKTNNRLVAEGSSGAVAQNILRNAIAESSRNWGNLQTQAGVYSNSYTTDQKKSGSRSVRLNLEDDTASSIRLPTGIYRHSRRAYTVCLYKNIRRLYSDRPELGGRQAAGRG